MPFAARLVAVFDDGSSAKHRRNFMLDGLLQYYRIVECGGLFLSSAEHMKLEDVVRRTLVNYAYLANMHMNLGNVRYNITYRVPLLPACTYGLQKHQCLQASDIQVVYSGGGQVWSRCGDRDQEIRTTRFRPENVSTTLFRVQTVQSSGLRSDPRTTKFGPESV